MQNKYVVCAALALMFSGVVCAAENQSTGTVSEIMRLNDEIQALQLELKRVDLQAQIAAKKAESAPRSVASLPTSGLPPPIPGGAGGRSLGEMPVVTGLEGVDGKLRATLAMSGEGTVVVAEGDVLSGGWRVEQITEASVSVRRDKERRSLLFSRGSAPRQSPDGMGSPTGY